MIITLCGSARFENEFHQWNQALSLSGHVVLSLAVHPSLHRGNKDWYTPEQKQMLDAVHLTKITSSDAIMVINRDNYIGDSTASEIRWAWLHKKAVYSLEYDKAGQMRPGKDLLMKGVELPEVPKESVYKEPERLADVFSDEMDLMSAYQNTTTGFNVDQFRAYVKMVVEETFEFLIACNKPLEPYLTGCLNDLHDRLRRATNYADIVTMDNVETFDGLLDMLVVAINAGYSAGYPMRAGWHVVFGSNMGKFGPNGELIKDANGKVQKPAGWTPPNEALARLLRDPISHKGP